MLLAASMWEKMGLVPENIESLAIFWGLQLCMHMGVSNIVIILDCQTVAQALQQQDESLAPLDNIFCAQFQQCSIIFNQWLSNIVAHRLARYA